MKCTNAGCAKENPDGARFCKKCGAKLPEPLGSDQTAPAVQPTTAPVQPTNAPPQPTNAPAVQPATAPVQPATAPVQPTTAPVQPTNAPPQPTNAPAVQPATAPAQPTTPPTRSAPARILAAVRWLLLLEPRRRGWSYVVVGLFYLVVLFGLALVFEGEPASDPDYTSIGSDIAVALVSIIIARLFAGLLIAWLEREPASEDT